MLSTHNNNLIKTQTECWIVAELHNKIALLWACLVIGLLGCVNAACILAMIHVFQWAHDTATSADCGHLDNTCNSLRCATACFSSVLVAAFC